jgi:hypothetical protein
VSTRIFLSNGTRVVSSQRLDEVERMMNRALAAPELVRIRNYTDLEDLLVNPLHVVEVRHVPEDA